MTGSDVTDPRTGSSLPIAEGSSPSASGPGPTGQAGDLGEALSGETWRKNAETALLELLRRLCLANEKAMAATSPATPLRSLPPRGWSLVGRRVTFAPTQGGWDGGRLLFWPSSWPSWPPSGSPVRVEIRALFEATGTPRLVLRAIRRLEAIEAWCLRVADARRRQAQHVLRAQARQAAVVQAIATAVRLERGRCPP